MNANNPGSQRQSIDEIVAAARARLDRIEPEMLEHDRKLSAHPIDSDTLDWYRTLQACRILTELNG